MRMSRPALFALAVTATVLAGARGAGGEHERARDAVAEGRILPLSAILDRMARNLRGDLLEVELERADAGNGGDDAGYRYEITVLAPNGDVTVLIYDAATGRQLGARGHDIEEHVRDGDENDDGDDEADKDGHDG